MLKILFIVKDFPTISETFIVNQIIFLINKGHEVQILSIHHRNVPIQDQIQEYDLMKRVTFIDIPANYFERLIRAYKLLRKNKLKTITTFNPFKYGRDVFNLLSFYKVSWLYKFEDNFDIVHAHFGFSSEIYFRAKRIGFFNNSKLITSFHGYDMAVNDLQKNKKRYKTLFENNTVLTTNNEYGRSLIQKIKPSYQHIRLLPVSLDTRFFEPVNNSMEGYFKIVYCGRLIKLKGPHLVVEIANEIINKRNYKNIKFVLIGDGKERDYLESLINKYNLSKHVLLKGSLVQGDVIKVLQNSRLFLLPGITDENLRAETQGLVIQEAQAMRLPVLVSSAGGMKYGILPEKSGFVIPEGDVKKFSDKIEYLIRNPLRRKKMGEIGRNFVIKNFDIKPLGKKLEQIYFETLRNTSN